MVDEPDVDRAPSERHGPARLIGGGAFRMLVGGALLLGLVSLAGRGGKAATRAVDINSFGYQRAIGAPGAFIKIHWDRPKAIRSGQVLQPIIIWRASIAGDFQIVGVVQGDTIRSFVDFEAARDVVNVFDGAPGADRRRAERPSLLFRESYRAAVSLPDRHGLQVRNGRYGQPGRWQLLSRAALLCGCEPAVACVGAEPARHPRGDLSEERRCLSHHPIKQSRAQLIAPLVKGPSSTRSQRSSP